MTLVPLDPALFHSLAAALWLVGLCVVWFLCLCVLVLGVRK